VLRSEARWWARDGAAAAVTPVTCCGRKAGIIEELCADYITVMADDGTRQTYG